MHCAHCLFSCTGKGSFMTAEVFEKCLAIANEYSMDITLGGGEPTLHPQFLKWTMQAVLATVETSMEQDGPAVMVITNGKKTEVALTLAKLAHLGVVQAELSQDEWHEYIDPQVVKEFSRYKVKEYGTTSKSLARIRTVNRIVVKGRAAENYLGDHDECGCSCLFIAPNGDFYRCGCKKTKLGNLLTDEIPESLWEHPDECEVSFAEKELTPA